ncbi:DUF6493 family protein [Actinomadura nitritigenes]|uniref:DUF7824 domain-containing protein n=1 Tax=Actinomadura nitritigenes TaxID=134602 RepID=UPI003D944609
MTTTAWDEIAALIDARKADAVAGAVLSLDAAGRREVAEALPGHVREVRSRRETWEGIDDFAPAFRAAGAGTLGGASAVASWLGRREFNSRWTDDHHDTALLMGLWQSHDDAWLAELARRLALRLRGPRHTGLNLVLALLRATGAEPPEHDPLVVGWAASAPPRTRDPLLPVLLPRIFEAEGVGRELRDSDRWVRGLTALAARGQVDRGMLLDGCVRRFLRGGTALDLRFFVRLHDALAPSEAEAGARARDYARLLPAAPGPVAESALDLLKDRDDLPPDLVVEALDGLLFRAESGLVRTGLSWLERTVRRHPDLADGCAAALARAFGHESYAVRQRAVRVALKLPAATDGAALRDAVPLLPPDLAAQVVARFGGEVSEADPVDDDPAPPTLAVPERVPEPAPEPLPPPITTPVELAKALQDGIGWAVSEQLLAAYVRLIRQDRDALRAALIPVLHRDFHPYLERLDFWLAPQEWLVGIGRLLIGSPVRFHPRRIAAPVQGAPLDRLFLQRFAEVYRALEDGTPPPVLLATPTRPTGHVDALALVERLEECEAAGVEPGSADLQQALLRLPLEPDGEAARRAGRLVSQAGRAAARWLAEGGAPRGDVEVRAGTNGVPEVVIGAEPTGLPLVDAVLTGTPRYVDRGRNWNWTYWPRLLPSHPDAVAAHLVPWQRQRREWSYAGMPVSVLVDRTSGTGALAEAVAFFLACQLALPDDEEAGETLLVLAARGDLPAAALGRHIGRLALAGRIKLVRVVEALERAAEAGAYAEVWETIAAALPLLHPEPGQRPPFAHDRLIALGARTARWAKASGPVPEIEELAARKGTSSLLRAARTLAAQLR